MVLLEEVGPLFIQPHPLHPPHGLALAPGRVLRQAAILGDQLLPVRNQSNRRALHETSQT